MKRYLLLIALLTLIPIAFESIDSNSESVVQNNPQSAEEYYSRGRAYQKQDEDDLALADYNKAIEINPQYAEAYNNRGLLYYEEGKLELALADFNKTIEINPQLASAYGNRGLLYKKEFAYQPDARCD